MSAKHVESVVPWVLNKEGRHFINDHMLGYSFYCNFPLNTALSYLANIREPIWKGHEGEVRKYPTQQPTVLNVLIPYLYKLVYDLDRGHLLWAVWVL